MITYTKGRVLGEGTCSVCRFKRKQTLEITKASKGQTVKRRWCQECFEQAKIAADHSADMGR